MSYSGRLNFIEYGVTTVVSDTWSPNETDWLGTVSYSSSHKTAGTEYNYKTTTIAKGDTYGNTPQIIKKVTRVYSAKFTKSKKNYQNYREHTVYTITGFLSCLNAAEISAPVDLTKNQLFSKDFMPNATKVMREPTEVSYNMFDVDTKTENKKEVISSLERDPKGHITRKRVATNLVELNITWTKLTEDELAVILEWLSKSQYLRVGFYNPVTKQNEARAMCNATRNFNVAYRGKFDNLNITLTEV